MRCRYLISYRQNSIAASCRSRLTAQMARLGLTVRIDEPDLVIFAPAQLPVHQVGGTILLGPAFLGSGEPVLLAEDAGDYRTRASAAPPPCWGHYVTVQRLADGAMQVSRAPFGDLGCYIASAPGGLDLGSDAAILRDAGLSPKIAWDAVVHQLCRSDIVTAETSLIGLEEIQGGDKLTLRADGRSARTRFWTPWDYASNPFTTLEQAREAVRNAIELSVRSSVANLDHVLLLLSGGLDSSILAACLAKQNAELTCMTLRTRDAAGDEFAYAEMVSDHIGARLVAIERDAAGVDLDVSASRDLPRPIARSFTQDGDDSAQSLARDCGAQVIIDGGGGDNVFCSHRSVAAVADGLLAPRERSALWATAASLSDLTGASMVRVLVRAARRAWLRPTATRLDCDTSLLSPAAQRMARGRADHHWLTPPPGALPGKAVHVALLAVAQAMVESTEQTRTIPTLSPLATQPVLEACLRVPSMWWFAPGQDRALARAAFPNDLPAAILHRRSKGVPNRYAASLVDAHRAQIGSLLLDGLLAGQGLLDVDAIRTLLNHPTPSLTYAFTRVLQLVDAEAWARSWA